MANQCFDQKQESLEPEQEPSDKNELFHWILTLAIAVIIALCVNRFVLVNAEIPSGSMENTIMTGDRVFGNRLAYIFGEPKRFDIIIFRYPDDEKQLFIKRIIGLPGETVEILDRKFDFTCVSMGNPHAVLFVDNTAAVPLETIGPKFENHSRFPDRTNTEFVEIVDRGHIKMRVWERGSGETMACGTGACASAVASILAGYTDTKVEVELLGGSLTIEWDREKDTVYMTGPAEEVFSGEIDLKF